jgi:hypothetical protein
VDKYRRVGEAHGLTSSAVVTARYRFTRRERFYGKFNATSKNETFLDIRVKRPFLIKFGFSRHIFTVSPHIKFNGDPSIGSRADADGHDFCDCVICRKNKLLGAESFLRSLCFKSFFNGTRRFLRAHYLILS